MARKTEKYMEYGKKTENHVNEENPLDDLKKDEITEKREK
ncbi:hypothetical protein T4D_14459 [Trichinella pseudospiralis]|uniref:Uncharacterized protein n=1 Tax=Trichinella pseudospiralis TaxID=6337 RepID=A0A0V1DLL5_TRIPS|nr:hypothetical protein T4D_14459 [Trichinella pseudospiralis]